MRLSVESNIQDVIKNLNDFQLNEVPFAASRALNDTAFNLARKHLPKYVDRIFDGGATRWTKSGSRYSDGKRFPRATKKRLEAVVYYDDETHPYISLMVNGGVRTPENRSILVPVQGNIRKNKFGNITRGRYSRILDNAKGAKDRYFSGVPGGKAGKRYEGIWERHGRGRKKIRMVMGYHDQTTYANVYYDFYGETRRYVCSKNKGFEFHFRSRLDQAIKSSLRRKRARMRKI